MGNQRYDVIITGSGIVGSALALALARASLKVALVEAMPVTTMQNQSGSKQIIALAHSSRLILEAIDCWSVLEPLANPIHQIHVSDRGNFGATKLSANEEGLPALGYTIAAGAMIEQLRAKIRLDANIDLLQPASFEAYEYAGNQVKVTIHIEKEPQSLVANLLVGADGQHSAIRAFQNVTADKIEYDQVAIFCQVALKRSHQGIAYERFTPQGPLAMLPLSGQKCAVVWTVAHSEGAQIMALENKCFLSRLQQEFGYRLGKFIACDDRQSVVLSLIRVPCQVQSGAVLLGNAVHTLHPVAGQGFNLSLRDVAVLAQTIIKAKRDGHALGNINILKAYLQDREPEQKKIIRLTHSLVTIFSNRFTPVVGARSLGLVALDRASWLKKMLTKTTLGFSGKVPRMACGMPLE